MKNKIHSSEAPKKLCLCKALKPAIFLCKIFGLFPITTTHKNNECIFEKSKFWIAFTLLRVLIQVIQVYFTTDLFDVVNLGKGKSLHQILDSVNAIVYGCYIALLTFISLLNSQNFIKAFNRFKPILNEGLLCEKSLKKIYRVQFGYICVIITMFIVQYITITSLYFSDKAGSKFNFKLFLNRFIQNITFIFYLLFCSIGNVFIAILSCNEKLVIKALEYKPIHPMDGFDEMNNRKVFLAVINYTVCDTDHKLNEKHKNLTTVEIVEYLRKLHEEISLIMYEINDCFNPQLLVHTMVELTVLIIHWYAVIIYAAYDFTSSESRTIHFLNCFFSISHSIGLFMFLKNAQAQSNTVQNLSNFLLEFSTRISLPEEYQQVRFFIDKIKLHRPMMASGIFTLNLGIAGPICANILTYVLVALQFEVPKS